MSKHQVKQYMKTVVASHYDPITYDVNTTTLAEDAADYFGHDEWLDDELSIVWEAASEVACIYERQFL